MIWIFGYGSLMWRPGFPFVVRRPAHLAGFSRAFCRLSFRHRGTPEAPGMVLGLVPGGGCQGVAYGVAPAEQQAVLSYLDAREGEGYRRMGVSIEMENGSGPESGEALTYLPEPSHATHAPGLPEARMAELIASGVGKSGTARDYLRELLVQLKRLEVEEPALSRLMQRVEKIAPPEATIGPNLTEDRGAQFPNRN